MIELKIKQAILEKEEPFSLADLYSYFEDKGITNKKLILEVFNFLFDAGLIVLADASVPKYKSILTEVN